MKYIESNYGFIAEEIDGRIVAYFAFIPSPEPTYNYIEGGFWLNEAPYHVVHRIGSYQEVHGVFRAIMDWCFSKDPNIRIDTHRNNHRMLHLIEENGFVRCGIIITDDGTPRIAFQKIV